MQIVEIQIIKKVYIYYIIITMKETKQNIANIIIGFVIGTLYITSLLLTLSN